MLSFLPRQVLLRLFALCLAAVTLLAISAPAVAKDDSEIKSIKKELVQIQSTLDAEITALDRLGKRWDKLESRGEKPAINLSAFIVSVMGAAEQAHIETLILQARNAIEALEVKRDDTITKLQKIVVERQEKKLQKSGVSPATMPSIDVGGGLVTYSADWEETAMCESTKRWHIDSQYDGGLQFDPITWIEFGGAEFARYAYEASKLEQIAVAERVLAIQGPGAWPNCFQPLPADA